MARPVGDAGADKTVEAGGNVILDGGGSYAQKNVLQLKHNNEVDTYGNGYFYVNNKNLKDEQVIVDSKLFALPLDLQRLIVWL